MGGCGTNVVLLVCKCACIPCLYGCTPAYIRVAVQICTLAAYMHTKEHDLIHFYLTTFAITGQ